MDKNFLQEALPTIIMIGALVVAVIVMIVPQRRRDKKLKKMLDSIKKGDKIRTIGGIYGKVISVKDDFVVVETGPEKMQIEFAKAAVSSIADSEFENSKESL